ncbi:MAG: DinB family protein [Chloroflexi bacterium]|nr:DinB family protein [Chloroflexota bacterium]
MATDKDLTLLQRRDRVLEQLDESHKALHASLEGLDPDDAFLGSRYSVWEVLKHLDAENYVDRLEKIASGEIDMLAPFDSREDRLKKDIAHLDETHERFRALVASLTEERMAQQAIPHNAANNFPGLTLLELVERSSGHEATHAHQIVETRKYVTAFAAKERAVTFIVLDPANPSHVGDSTIGLLKYADNVAGTAEALDAVRNFATGNEQSLNGENNIEIIARMGRDARAGVWNLVCTIGSPAESHQELLQMAEQHCDKVVIMQASQ